MSSRPPMSRNEVSRLRAQLARRGELPTETVGQLLGELDRALARMERQRELLLALRRPWGDMREAVLGLAVLLGAVDEDPPVRRRRG